jgi:hypothetical protein
MAAYQNKLSSHYTYCMQFLRKSHLIARFALVWFALFVCVAAASPVINPQSMELICSGSGVMKLVIQNNDGASEASAHTQDCFLCGVVGAPPPVGKTLPALAQPLSFALKAIPQARIAALTGAPLPARGPPTFS